MSKKQKKVKNVRYELVTKEGELLQFATAVSCGNMWEAITARRNRQNQKKK